MVAPTLNNADVRALTLSRINVDISDDQEYFNIIGRMSRGEYEFTKSPPHRVAQLRYPTILTQTQEKQLRFSWSPPK
jgi:hypothetical protein